MNAKIGCLLVLLSLAAPLSASAWEWQVTAGPWSLQPLTSPVERLAGRIVAAETEELLAPLLSEFTLVDFTPEVDMRSWGTLLAATVWRRLAAGRFAVGASLAYLSGELPFAIEDTHGIYFEDILIAEVSARGDGRIDLDTFMLAFNGRWRAWRQGRSTVHLEGGLALLRLRGRLTLPIRVRLRTPLGQAELTYLEDITLDELRRENTRVPAWSLSPALGATFHYRLGNKIRLVLEARLSQGAFLGAGLGLDP